MTMPEITSLLRSSKRNQSGAIMPFLVFCVLIIAAFLALSVDIMRNVKAVNNLSFAAESAALHAYSLFTDSNGSYTAADADARMRSALQTSGGAADSAWNTAPSGPADYTIGPFNSGVTFAGGDARLVTNPADNSEVWLQVTARRQGADALRMMFLPMVLAMNASGGENLPQNAYQVEPWRTCEVVGQPASRIGPGAPHGTSGRAAELSNHAVLPIGITLREFQLLASPSETRTRYQVDMQASASPAFGQPADAGHLRGYFVNITADGSSDYYGAGTGNRAIDQLIGTLDYFGTSSNAVLPAAIERGGRLAWYDQSDVSVQQRKQQILAALQRLPARTYTFPVLRNDPQIGARNEVVGFARLRLVQAVNTAATDYNLVVDVADSVPVRNASSATGTASIPPLTQAALPAPVAPFLPRQMIVDSNALEIRPRAVALAPAVSPRLFNVSQ